MTKNQLVFALGIVALLSGLVFWLLFGQPKCIVAELSHELLALRGKEYELIFSVKWVDYRADFEKGVLSRELRHEFQKHAIRLPNSVVIRPGMSKRRWHMPTEERILPYLVERETDVLRIYEPRWPEWGTDELYFELFVRGAIKLGIQYDEVIRLLGKPTYEISMGNKYSCTWIAMDGGGLSERYVITFDGAGKADFVPWVRRRYKQEGMTVIELVRSPSEGVPPNQGQE